MHRLLATSLVWSALFLSVSFPRHAHAQEQATASGAEVPPSTQERTEEELAWQRRRERADGFRQKMLQTRRGVELYYDLRRKSVKDAEQNRQRCREDLRRANRDALFPALLLCTRKELVMEKTVREKQREYAGTVPGVSEELRTRAQTDLGSLVDAITSVIEGAETGVFQKKEDLVEARKNLHAVYRVPALLALLRLEADRSATWVAHLLTGLFTMTQNTSVSPDAFAKASDALRCFEDAETRLAGIGSSDDFGRENGNMSAGMAHLLSCADLLGEAHALQNLSENPPAEEEEDRSMVSPRRRWSGD